MSEGKIGGGYAPEINQQKILNGEKKLTELAFEHINPIDFEKVIELLREERDRYEQALREIESSAFDCGDNYQTAKEAAIWMNGRASEALGDLS